MASFPRRVATPCLALAAWLLAAAPPSPQPIPAGVAYLAGIQEADGSWESAEVRRVHATGEALRALQAVAQSPGARASAAGILVAEPVEDSDDRARRRRRRESQKPAGAATSTWTRATPSELRPC